MSCLSYKWRSFVQNFPLKFQSKYAIHLCRLLHHSFQRVLKIGSINAQQQRKHFVLIHGGCHGAWCWFKLKPFLEASGHRVTALDMAASGINLKEIHQVHTLFDYTMPLLEFLGAIPSKEKVVLVGHSQAGFNLALAMDKFPEKIAVSVFLSAFMPDTVHSPSYVFDKSAEIIHEGGWQDTLFLPYDDESNSGPFALLGPKYLAANLYQLCSTEDLELATMLVRMTTLLTNDLSNAKPFSEQGYGSVKRVFITSDQDLAIPKDFQLWMIENNPVVEVKNLKGVDHMSMLSDPRQLSLCLLEVALKYA